MSGPRTILLQAVGGVLERIRVADGYNTDAGASVTLEPAPKLSEGSHEFITVVWARQDRATDPALANTHRLTTFNVLAKVPTELERAQEVLDQITEDIETAMADRQASYPVGYQFPQYRSAEPMAPENIASGWIGVNVTYTSHIPKRRPAA